MSLLPVIFVILLAIALAGVSYFAIAKNGDVLIESVDQAWRCYVTPFYSRNIEPIINAIHRFFNPVICWWDGLILWPQLIGRNVVFPVILDCGLLDVMVNMGSFFEAVFQDWLIGHIASGAFFTEPLDYTLICNRWQVYWASWQSLLCCGCFDLCAPLTRLPMLPMMFTSSQFSDDEWWCFIDNFSNGILIVFQEGLRIISLVLYSHPGPKRPNLRPAVDRFCEAARCFVRSWENALQLTWDTFIPFEFVWRDFLGVFSKIACVLIHTGNLMIDIIFGLDLLIDHFSGTDSTFWKTTIKRQVAEVANMLTTASRFDPISVPTPSGPMEITHYQLSPYDQATPEGLPNPLFGQQGQLVTDCACVFIERLLCDPTNNGTTCAQAFAGTLLEDVDICCFSDNAARAMVDMTTFVFEATLHMDNADNLVVFLDRQPFSLPIKHGVVEAMNCLFDAFRAIEVYGACIDNVLSESVLFVGCMAELTFRTVLALITLPHFETELPLLDNFLTRPGDEALNAALGFLDRAGDMLNPQGLINCLCFLMNSGFAVPPAGCSNVTTPCQPTGFIDPTLPPMRSVKRGGLHDYTQKYGLQPIHMYPNTGKNKGQSIKNGYKALASVIPAMDARLDSLHGRLSTMPPANMTVGCDTCFNLCCLPSKVVTLVTHGSAFGFRALNAAFQTRLGGGSGYWDGTDCTMTPGGGGALTGICLATDATTFISNLLAPLTCLCNFIQLVIPPMDGIDPCCLFTLLGDMLGCVIQIVINVANSAASDPLYRYIKDESMLQSDFDIVADISIAAVDCACDAIRTVFNFIQDVTPLNLNMNFDPCCIPQKVYGAIVDAARLLFRLIIALATLDEPSSQCYLFVRDTIPGSNRANCVVGVAQLPVVQRFNDILDKFFAPPSESGFGQCVQTGNNQGVEGISTCYCTMVQSVMGILFKPESDLAASCPLNLCCIIYRTGTILDEALRFGAQMLASLWQNWTKETIANIVNVGPTKADIPAGFVDFFFCDEYFTPGGSVVIGPGGQPSYVITNPASNSTFQLSDPQQRCGRMEPILNAFQDAVNECFCARSGLENTNPAIGNVLDNFLSWFFYFIGTSNPEIFGFLFQWPRCLCSGGRSGNGIIRPTANVLTVALRQIIILARNLPNPTYWKPESGSFTNDTYVTTLVNNIEDIEQSWIARFLGPFADSLCEAATNLACLLALILGSTCEAQRYNVVASVVRYALEAAIKAMIIIEAFVRLFLQEMPGVCVGDQNQVQGDAGANLADDGSGPTDSCAPQNAIGAIFGQGDMMTEQLTSMLVSTTQFIVDATIGVGAFSCTKLCPFSMDAFTYQPDLVNYSAPMFANENRACSCYRDTPYKAGVEFATTLESCRYTLNLPAGGSVCPNNGTTCSYNQACGNPENATFILNPATGLFRTPVRITQFRCDNSLSAGVGGVVDIGVDYGVDRANAFDRWVHIVVPQGFTNRQPTGCVFGEVPDDFGSFIDPGTLGFSPTYIGVAEKEFQGLRSTGTPTEDGMIPNWGTNPSTQAAEWVALPIGMINGSIPPGLGDGVCGLDTTGLPAGEVSMILAESVRQFGPGILGLGVFQPFCAREMCVANGFCKNDQMVPCSKSPPGQDPLDGIAMAFLKYLLCIVRDLQSKARSAGGDSGNFLYDVMELALRVVITIVSIVWQLSAGLIKLVVSATVLTAKFMLDFNPITRLISGVFLVIDFFGNFFAIFSQPIVASAGTDPEAPFYGRTAHARVHARSEQKEFYDAALERTMGVNVDGCLEDPVGCMCVSDLGQSCDVNATTIAQVMMYMADVFTGATECDSLIQSCAGMAPALWTDVPYAERYLYVDCIGKRIRGERVFAYSNGMLDKDFFYSTDGWYKMMVKTKDGLLQNARRKDRRRARANKKTRPSSKKVTKSVQQYYRDLTSRAIMAKHVIRDRVGIPEESMAYQFTVEMDRVWFKYRSGYYHYLGDMAMKRIRRDGASVVLGTYEDNLGHFADAIGDISMSSSIVRHHVNEAATHVAHGVDRMYTGIHRMLVGSKTKTSTTKYVRERPQSILTWRKWVLEWPESEDGKSLWQRAVSAIGSPWALFRIDPAVRRQFTMSDAQWTPEKIHNVESVQRMLYGAAHTIVPHYVSREAHERFILNGNCRLVNDAIEETSMIIDFCLNNYAYALPNGTINGTFSRLRNYLDVTSPLRTGSIRRKYGDRVRVEMFAGNPRLRLIMPNQTTPTVHERRTYRRAMATDAYVGGFNFFEWIICAIEDIFNISILQSGAGIVTDIKAWFMNPNTDPAAYPNVGGVYWIKFFITCEFPENVSCMIGIGLEEALKKVTLIYLLVIVALLALGLLSVVTILLAPVVYFIIVLAVAYHWSPACLMVFPSFTLGAGISIPFLPIPIGAWALPMCLWDDIVTLISGLFTGCLDFIIPASLVNGPVCPVCPASIDFVNCIDIGMGDGLSNVLYLLFKWLGPTFCDVIIGISSTAIGGLIPGAQAYLMTVLNTFKSASPEQLERLDFCSIATAGSIAIVIVFAVFAGGILLFVIPALYGIVVAALGVLMSTNVYESLLGQGEPTEYDIIPGDDATPEDFEEEEEEEEAVYDDEEEDDSTAQGSDVAGRIASFLRRTVMRKSKQE